MEPTIIKSSNHKTIVLAWVLAGFWNLVAWPQLFALRKEIVERDNQAAWIVLIFPVVGIGLFIWAMRATLRWRKFGETVFELAGPTGVIGGALAGAIRLGQIVRPEDGFILKLQCVRRVTTGAGKSRSTSEHVLWEHVQKRDGSAEMLPVEFYIPPDCAESSDVNPNARVIWRLEATARVPGVDYAAQFEVPVFKAAQTPEQLAAAERARAAEKVELAHYQPPATSRIHMQTAARGGREFYFPAARNPGAASVITGLFAIWTGMVWALIYSHAPVLFTMVFGVFDFLLLAGMLSLWFGSCRVTVATDVISITGGILGRSREIPVTDVGSVKTKIGMTVGTKTYRDIKIVLRTGREIAAGKNIADAQEAEWLAQEMAKAAGLKAG